MRQVSIRTKRAHKRLKSAINDVMSKQKRKRRLEIFEQITFEIPIETEDT